MWTWVRSERFFLAAEKDTRRIAVEVQSFLGASAVRALQEAIGQHVVYREVMGEKEPERVLYMAVSKETHETLLSDKLGLFILTRLRVRLLVFDPEQERIVKWID
jgi:hypothetical protein